MGAEAAMAGGGAAVVRHGATGGALRLGAPLGSLALHAAALGLAVLLAGEAPIPSAEAPFAVALRPEAGIGLVEVRPAKDAPLLERTPPSDELPELATTTPAGADFPEMEAAVEVREPAEAWSPPVPPGQRIPGRVAASAPGGASEEKRAPADGAPGSGRNAGPAGVAGPGGTGAGPRVPGSERGEAARAPAPPSPRGAPVRQAPRPRDGQCDPPRYPRASRERGEEGRVLLRVSVDAEGEVVGVEVKVSSGFARLDAAAVDAISGWLFEPGREEGRAVAGVVEVPVGFLLK